MKLSEKLKRIHTFGEFPKDELIFDAITLEEAIEFFESCKIKIENKGASQNEWTKSSAKPSAKPSEQSSD